ncbi:hypothetical protein [Methylorubrum aminovorans]|uniref:hypothetical protein n=1 Tax=Methylorubrum aminovorans TaxID=269069 RepID=UPI001EDCDDB6|nr:hypothetical protein [Methylorubrum aminovorans]
MAYPQRWHRDLLVQATLDPAVSRIAPVPAEAQLHAPFTIFVWFGGKRRLLIAVRDQADVHSASSQPDSLVVTRSFVLQEPRCSVAREIWATRNVIVPPGDRIRILRELSEHAEGLPLGRLMDCVRGRETDPVEVVLALICAGQAAIEARSHLSLDTTIRPSAVLAGAMQWSGAPLVRPTSER